MYTGTGQERECFHGSQPEWATQSSGPDHPTLSPYAVVGGQAPPPAGCAAVPNSLLCGGSSHAWKQSARVTEG
eukprot:213086-Prorocentrum_lima.AAC.1